jgi:hypothetical protein
MRVPGETVTRTFRAGAAAESGAVREALLRLRGVRAVELAPEQGVVRVTVYPEFFDAEAAKKLFEGES